MIKVGIFGDCHTARVWEHYTFDESKFILKMWGKGGVFVYGLNIDDKISNDEISSGVEMPTKDYINEKIMNKEWEPKIKFTEIAESDLIMPWLGYVDIRQLLPKYKNPELIARMLVDKFLTAFPNKKLRFIEPLPQFTEMLLKYEGISESYEYKDRLEQNNKFIAELRKYCDEKNIMKPVSQDDIYRVCGVTEFIPSMTHNKAPHPVDGLQDEYHEKIYNLFIEEIEKTLEFYSL